MKIWLTYPFMFFFSDFMNRFKLDLDIYDIKCYEYPEIGSTMSDIWPSLQSAWNSTVKRTDVLSSLLLNLNIVSLSERRISAVWTFVESADVSKSKVSPFPV
jgi:hypothetical protein